MTVERQYNGSYHISDIVDGYLVQRTYYGYTKREAQKRFREVIKKEIKKDTSPVK